MLKPSMMMALQKSTGVNTTFPKMRRTRKSVFAYLLPFDKIKRGNSFLLTRKRVWKKQIINAHAFDDSLLAKFRTLG